MVAIITFAVMIQSNLCYFNGDLLPQGDIRLNASDLQLQRGYGVFDFFRSRNGSMPWLEDYLERLFTSIELSGIEVNMDQEHLTSVLHHLQQKNGMDNGAFKIIVTGGYSDNLESVSGQPNIMILNVPWEAPPQETFTRGVNLIKDKYARPNPEVKTLYYFNSLRLHKKLMEYKAVDVMYHTEKITETSRASLFFVKGDQVYTPASDILKGITRNRLLSIYSEIQVEDIEAGRLYDFDEVFITSTSRDITPVVSIEGRKIGNGSPGPLTREIQSAFRTADVLKNSTFI